MHVRVFCLRFFKKSNYVMSAIIQGTCVHWRHLMPAAFCNDREVAATALMQLLQHCLAISIKRDGTRYIPAYFLQFLILLTALAMRRARQHNSNNYSDTQQTCFVLHIKKFNQENTKLILSSLINFLYENELFNFYI